MKTFDPKTVRRNRQRALKHGNDAFFLMDWAVDNLCDRLDDIKRSFATSLVFGHRLSPRKLSQLTSHTALQNIIRADTSPVETGKLNQIVAEPDMLPFKSSSFDAVINIMTLHTVNDLPGALIQSNRVLKDDGLFIGCLFGGETLYQLRESFMSVEAELKGGISPRISPFADKQQMGALMQRAGFALPVIDSEIITTTYETPLNLMHDLRLMGESNAIIQRQKINPGKELIKRVCEHYQSTYADKDGRIEANFEIIFLLGWAPHESQQQPLPRGSAKVNLADALHTKEISSGVKPEDTE